MRAAFPSLLAVFLAAPALASAATEEGGASPFAGDVGTALWTVVIFLLVVFVLGKFAWGPVLRALQSREDFIRDSLEQAKRERDAAAALFKEYEEKVASARADATAIVEEGRRDADVVRHRIEAEAREEGEKMLKRARREIDIAKQTALKEIYELTARLATDVASRIIRKELDPQQHRRLIADSIERFEKVSRELMAGVDDRAFGIGRLYALAMLNVAEERGEADDLLAELDGMAAFMESSAEFAAFLATPLVESDSRRDSLERALRDRSSDLLVDALQVVNRKGRLALLPSIIDVYRREHLNLRGIVEVEVTSAVELSDEQRQRLQQAADRFTGRSARLVESIDPDILGGLVVRVEDDKIDTSVATELARLSHRLAERASHEIVGGRLYIEEA